MKFGIGSMEFRTVQLAPLTPREIELITFLEWLDCSREVTKWQYPEETHFDTVKKYLKECKKRLI